MSPLPHQTNVHRVGSADEPDAAVHNIGSDHPHVQSGRVGLARASVVDRADGAPRELAYGYSSLREANAKLLSYLLDSITDKICYQE
jgi:hypothetical protein